MYTRKCNKVNPSGESVFRTLNIKLFSCVFITLIFFCNILHAQDTLNVKYPLFIELPIVDLPFLKHAAQMNFNKNNPGVIGKVGFSNYLGAYESPSMQQALSLTKSLHAGNYYLNNKFWSKVIKPDTKAKRIWNRIAANASAGLVDVLFTYEGVVFSTQWMHEEFHRNGLTIRGIASYDETYNRFNGGDANGSVSRVLDGDMAAFKRETPQEMVRSFSAGIESEFLLMRNLQKDNFFRKASYPNVLLNILLTKHAVDYVNQFKRDDFNASIDSMNYHGTKVAERDFVGWDFTAWVYDLHRPTQSYLNRGIHPSGNGVNRAIKSTTLSTDEYEYLSKMGRMQYLNFISPFMLGIDRIRLNQNLAFNFAVRHYLTSFGYDLSADLMLDYKGKGYLFSFHGYRNKDKFFPGVELGIPEIPVNVFSKILTLKPVLQAWLQPEGQNFYTHKGKAGALIELRASYPLNRQFNIYTELVSKTSGWIAGNPYLRPNTGFRLGLSADLGKS